MIDVLLGTQLILKPKCLWIHFPIEHNNYFVVKIHSLKHGPTRDILDFNRRKQ